MVTLASLLPVLAVQLMGIFLSLQYSYEEVRGWVVVGCVCVLESESLQCSRAALATSGGLPSAWRTTWCTDVKPCSRFPQRDAVLVPTALSL